MDEITEFIEYVEYMIEQLPSGIDHDANEDDESPTDMQAHIGGLIWQKCQEMRTMMEDGDNA